MSETPKRRPERRLPDVLGELDRWADRLETGLQKLRRPGPILPADVSRRLQAAMLAPENMLEDARYQKIVPNDYLVELNETNYARHYQPVESTITSQWRDKLLEGLNIANSRLGRREYRFGGRVQVRLQPASDLGEDEIRLHCQINPNVGAAMPGTMTACLELLLQGRRWMLSEEVTVIGRDEACDIYLDLPAVQQKRLISGQHAHIRHSGDRFRLYDGSPEGRASVNGTFVNGRRVPPGGHDLYEGDVIILASLDHSQPHLDTPGVAAFVFREACS
ncbi:MAG: FHA domain-containing protein [Anaerolineae bacterium]|nr:FHA domain-containing protein [Anaerolineae bacterium]